MEISERPNFVKWLIWLIVAVVVVVVVVLFATGTIQSKWRVWRDTHTSKDQDNPPVLVQVSPLPSATPTPTATVPTTFTPYKATPTPLPNPENPLPRTGPELGWLLAGLLGVATVGGLYYRSLRKQLQQSSRNITVL